VKRRAAIVGLLLAGLAAGSAGTAQAAGPGLAASGRDSSGCVVLLPNAANPVTICLFPR